MQFLLLDPVFKARLPRVWGLAQLSWDHPTAFPGECWPCGDAPCFFPYGKMALFGMQRDCEIHTDPPGKLYLENNPNQDTLGALALKNLIFL